MPEVQYSTTMTLTREAVWDFVKDMNNWAPFLTGYQRHEIVNDTDSIWTLKGDVGVLARVVKLKAHVTEWSGPDRVAFTLTGLNEQVEGGGELVMTTATNATPVAIVKRGFFQRMMDAIARFFYRLANGRAPEKRTKGAGAIASMLTFTLRMDAGGPTGPLVNAMLAPALLPAAEDLANKIAAHLEQRAAS